ncbi:MAG: hypothetical protein ACXW04_09310 [Methylobacter sp.]
MLIVAKNRETWLITSKIKSGTKQLSASGDDFHLSRIVDSIFSTVDSCLCVAPDTLGDSN